ncbi:MAG: ATP phosphoribosyltransferase [Candidatus Thorarchaeota archaeon]|nr:ATP phosphoribosyltransferase [Candidatus Thorarchaeota archaeon]
MSKIKLAIPNGHLSKTTLETFARAGYKISGQERTYTPIINDHHIEVRVLRPQEIPTFVADGLQDLGVTGKDWLRETNSDVEILLDLEYSKVRIVIAIPETMKGIESLSDLICSFSGEDRPLRIFTEYLRLASKAIRHNPMYTELYGSKEPMIVTPWWKKGTNSKVGVYLSFGATEAKPPILADAIIEVADTGASLRQNGLRKIETLMESTAVLIANKQSIIDPAKHEKICDVMTLLRGVVEARRKLHIFANVKRDNLDVLLMQLPALRKPTVSPLSDSDWVAINTVIDRTVFLEIIPKLRRLAQGLVVYEPRQVLSLDYMQLGENNNE